ncbi:MAG: T9SS type A sorting domain-containing protein [Candidatus Cloacimonetes bacterium]|nr:T9SS type A sorting domain-containing protein [Candidatus Cloacimonadota bacterium]
MKEVYEIAESDSIYDKLVILETGVTYSGGLLIGKLYNIENGDFEGDGGLDVKIQGNGSILDLDGQEICISYCSSRLDIEDCVIINGNINDDPLFENDTDLILSEQSPYIDSGSTEVYGISFPEYDLLGNPRVSNGVIDMGAIEYFTDSEAEQVNIFDEMNLICYPNPFNPTTTISIKISSRVWEQNPTRDFINTKIEIFNVKGQKIREFEIRNAKLGINEVIWNGKDEQRVSVSSGIYLIKINQNFNNNLTKCILLK